MMKDLRELSFICFVLILLSMQGCQRAYSTRDPSQPSAPTEHSASESSSITATANNPATTVKRDGMALIKGGTFVMGVDDGMPYEAPAHKVAVKSFWIDEHEVTVEEFSRFVAATGYKTDAEKFGWSGVFNLKSGKWERVDGANWRHPEGPKSKPAADEPVCQVSWTDAQAYAKWAGKRLPT